MIPAPAKFNAEVDRYYEAGIFTGVPAPSRPLNPERDFNTTILTSDEGRLMRADLLTEGSAAEYRALLKAGKDSTEANEGLGILAIRAGDRSAAHNYMEAARRGGTKNAAALTSYAAIEKDPEAAIAILKEALTADDKYAPAHWALGERISEPARRLAEWKQAVALAPRNYEWWGQYAQLCVDQKQYAEAGRAWIAAAQAAPDLQQRRQYLDARAKIDQLRLEDEDAARRRELAAKNAELDRLKAQAKKEIADLEARANTRPLSKEELAKTVDWDDINGSTAISGTLIRVDCVGRQYRLTVKDEIGKTLRLSVADPSQIEITGPDPALSCGPQKPRRVKIAYKPAKPSRSGDAGEIAKIEFR